ncbi:MAG: DUF2062 domain-containing protein [Methylophaga sp.]|nr:DUF2062 domain-containing protein [Methylophaga sp.]
MPRKFLKSIMPDHAKMREHPHLQRFGARLTEPRLWHLNRRSVAGGLAIGLFLGVMPMIGQMVVAAALCIWLRVNLPIAVMAVWISNPFTFVPIFYTSYRLGAWILEIPPGSYRFNLSLEWFTGEFLLIWKPLLLGSFINGLLAALAGIIFVRLVWRLVVIRSWLQRLQRNRRGDKS